MSIKITKKHISPNINITPFVDILLVLLIVFMISSPALVAGLKVDLPNGKSIAKPNSESKNIVITIDQDGKIYFNDKECKKNKLLQKFRLIENNENTSIFVRGDRKIVYSQIMDVINIAALAGFENVILVTQDE